MIYGKWKFFVLILLFYLAIQIKTDFSLPINTFKTDSGVYTIEHKYLKQSSVNGDEIRFCVLNDIECDDSIEILDVYKNDEGKCTYTPKTVFDNTSETTKITIIHIDEDLGIGCDYFKVTLDNENKSFQKQIYAFESIKIIFDSDRCKIDLSSEEWTKTNVTMKLNIYNKIKASEEYTNTVSIQSEFKSWNGPISERSNVYKFRWAPFPEISYYECNNEDCSESNLLLRITDVDISTVDPNVKYDFVREVYDVKQSINGGKSFSPHLIEFSTKYSDNFDQETKQNYIIDMKIQPHKYNDEYFLTHQIFDQYDVYVSAREMFLYNVNKENIQFTTLTLNSTLLIINSGIFMQENCTIKVPYSNYLIEEKILTLEMMKQENYLESSALHVNIILVNNNVYRLQNTIRLLMEAKCDPSEETFLPYRFSSVLKSRSNFTLDDPNLYETYDANGVFYNNDTLSIISEATYNRFNKSNNKSNEDIKLKGCIITDSLINITKLKSSVLNINYQETRSDDKVIKRREINVYDTLIITGNAYDSLDFNAINPLIIIMAYVNLNNVKILGGLYNTGYSGFSTEITCSGNTLENGMTLCSDTTVEQHLAFKNTDNNPFSNGGSNYIGSNTVFLKGGRPSAESLINGMFVKIRGKVESRGGKGICVADSCSGHGAGGKILIWGSKFDINENVKINVMGHSCSRNDEFSQYMAPSGGGLIQIWCLAFKSSINSLVFIPKTKGENGDCDYDVCGQYLYDNFVNRIDYMKVNKPDDEIDENDKDTNLFVTGGTCKENGMFRQLYKNSSWSKNPKNYTQSNLNLTKSGRYNGVVDICTNHVPLNVYCPFYKTPTMKTIIEEKDDQNYVSYKAVCKETAITYICYTAIAIAAAMVLAGILCGIVFAVKKCKTKKKIHWDSVEAIQKECTLTEYWHKLPTKDENSTENEENCGMEKSLVERFETMGFKQIPASEINIIKKISTGGQATVFKASYLNSQVCIKIYDCQKKGTWSVYSENPTKAALVKECLLLATIKSPNILRVYGYSIQPEYFGLVMDYAEGGDLSNLYKGILEIKRKYNVSNDIYYLFILKIGICISSALEAMHNLGAIHLDLKPGNVLISTALPDIFIDDEVQKKKFTKGKVYETLFQFIKKMQAVLADLGLSHLMNDASKTKSVTARCDGTPMYMDYILFFDVAVVSPKSDCFALGTILFMLMNNGIHPLKGLTTTGIVDHLLQYKVPLIPGQNYSCISLYPELYHIIKQCWNVNLKSRLSAAEIRESLFSIYKKQIIKVQKEIFGIEEKEQ